jgi:hypothetical protein
MSSEVEPLPGALRTYRTELDQLTQILPAACAELRSQLAASDFKEHGALSIYGVWTSCTTFSAPVEQFLADETLRAELVRFALSSKETSCLQAVLILVSASLAMNPASATAWLDAGIFSTLMDAFAPEQCTATRKLAFDLAFVIVHARLRIRSNAQVDHDSDFGFKELVSVSGGVQCPAAAREFQVTATNIAMHVLLTRHRLWCCLW